MTAIKEPRIAARANWGGSFQLAAVFMGWDLAGRPQLFHLPDWATGAALASALIFGISMQLSAQRREDKLIDQVKRLIEKSNDEGR